MLSITPMTNASVTFLISLNSTYNLEWLGLRWLDPQQHVYDLKLNASIYGTMLGS